MGIDKRRSGVGRGESGDRQGVCSEEGTVWGVWGSGVGVDGVVREEEEWGERGQDEGQSRKRGRGDRQEEWGEEAGLGDEKRGQEEEWGGRGRE